MISTGNFRYKTETIGSDKISELEPRINFLFVVYNEIEMGEMQQVLEPISGFSVILDFIEQDCLQHFYIGKFFKYNIVLAKTSDMGSRNVNSVVNVINRAIQIFRPRYIVMPGIAAGLDDKVNIGDVVIADKIIGYESEKIAPAEIIGRYPEYRSPRLFNLFSSASVHPFNLFLKSEIEAQIADESANKKVAEPDCKLNCPKVTEQDCSFGDFVDENGFPEVFTGNYISGEKLLDNSTYRSYLKTKFKEAMALDMEGAGVASASTFNRVYDWLVIKGISDLGDGNKGKNKTARQKYAMRNVITVLKKVFDDELSFSENNLKQVQGYNRKNVLISASQCEGGAHYELTSIFMEELARKLIIGNCNVITGYGLGVGPAVMYGIFDGCGYLRLPVYEYTDRFQCYAFPKVESSRNGDRTKIDKCKEINRKILCSNVQIAVFAFGNKKGKSSADGMIKELDAVAENNALILPIGCTEGTARKIFDLVVSEIGIEKYLLPHFRDRKKYRMDTVDVNKAIETYVNELKKINETALDENNIDAVVNAVVGLINLFG